jgi:hypothetical protein
MDNRAKIASSISVAWIGGAVAVMAMNWDELNALKLNEAGDFLAGVVAPLAFLWLIVGYFQQGDELKQNTEALRLQAEELKHAVKEYAQLNATNLRHLDLQLTEINERKLKEQAALKLRLLLASTEEWSRGVGVLGIKFNIKNVGHEALRATFHPENKDISIHLSGQHTISREQEFPLYVNSDDCTPRSRKILISYTNGAGEGDIYLMQLYILPDRTMFLAVSENEIEAMNNTFSKSTSDNS